MSEEIKYYFIFGSLFIKPLNGYYAEIITPDYFSKEQIMYALRKYYQMGDYLSEKQIYEESKFKFLERRNDLKIRNGCSEKIYFPLPDDIKIDQKEPFLSKLMPSKI